MVADISYTTNATDVTIEVAADQSQPDVFMHASYITDAILFAKTFKEMGFNPRSMLTSRLLPLAWSERWNDGR